MITLGRDDQATDPAPRSLYRRIAADFRDRIRSHTLGEGERLPTIRALASELGVNRDTVTLAYELLASEGLVESAVGRGTFVRATLHCHASSSTPVPSLAPQVDRLIAHESGRLRFANGKDLVALHSLVPDPAFYPVDAFRRCFNRVLARGGPELLLYAAPQGHPGLRDVLAERFRNVGVDVGAEQVVLCHGASQGISLAVRLFAETGDALAVEAPTYHNVLSALVALGVRPVPVPMGADGPDLSCLEQSLARPEVKAFYTIPSFHNPLGSTTTVAHRRRVLEIAARCGKPIIEDAFETDLHHSTRPVPSLAALDAGELVVHLISFSKSLFPGLRIGAIAARGRAIEGLLALKHATDLSDSLPLQAALEDFLRSGNYDRHLTRLRRTLRSRRAALLEALTESMPPGTTWTEPGGGYQLWVELPFDVDTRDLLSDAARAGVLFAPGAQFSSDHRPSRGMRLTIARADEREIRRGVAAIGRVVRDRLEEDPTARQSASVQL